MVPELAQLASHAGTAGDGQEVGWDTEFHNYFHSDFAQNVGFGLI